MIDKIIKLLASKSCTSNLSTSDWLMYCKQFKEITISLKPQLIKALAQHSGASEFLISDTFARLNQEIVPPDVKIYILSDLQKAQNEATIKIKTMKGRTIFNNIDLESLSISRTEWLSIIKKFELQERSKLTPLFFFNALSSIRKVKYDELTDSLSKPRPSRLAKRTISGQNEPTAKRSFRSFQEDDGQNPLILEETDENQYLQSKIEATGARYSKLSSATPDKRYTQVVRTPGGNKARPLCNINGQTLFKPLTPMSKAPKQGRVDIGFVSRTSLAEKLKKPALERAKPVKFIATLEKINARSGLPRRQSQFSITKVKASDVFRAHGIEIQPADGRFHHWSHLIAHFMGDVQDIITENQNIITDDLDIMIQEPEEEIINLIPSTSASNYNTLETIELFIRKKLLDEDTDKIHITVTPLYNGDLVIPDMLTYSLSWVENYNQEHTQIFYISPQSYERITKSMHSSIDVLREHGKTISDIEESSSSCDFSY